jgi:nucleotide-binding universal stress UspA family protein
MSTLNTRYTVLAAIDYSEFSTSVLEHAIEIAKRHRPSVVHFLHVNHARGDDDDGQECRRIELLEWVAARLTEPEGAMAGITIRHHEVVGDPARVIVELAEKLAADVAVLGTHGRTGLQRLMLGSVAEAVSRNCSVSVLVVRRKVDEQRLLELEPPCGLCVEARLQSGGNVLYCHDHVARRDRRYASYSDGVGQRVSQSLMG